MKNNDGMRVVGHYTFKSKGTYNGEWLNGRMHGYGKFIRPDGMEFEGYFNSSTNTGFGTVKEAPAPSAVAAAAAAAASTTSTSTTDNSSAKIFESGWKDHGSIIKPADPYGIWSNPLLTDKDWQLIFNGAKTISIPPEQRLLEQGGTNNKLYRVKSGRLRVERMFDAKTKVLGHLMPPTVLGDASLIRSREPTTVVADNDQVEVEVVDFEILLPLFTSDPGLSARFYRTLAKKQASQLMKQQPTYSSSSSSDHAKPSSRRSSSSSSSSANVSQDSSKRSSAPSMKSTGSSGDIPSTSVTDSKSSTTTSSSNSKRSIQSKFQLKPEESLLDETECSGSSFRSLLKVYGKLYLFDNYICFESSVFGQEQLEVIPFSKVSALNITSDSIKVEAKGKKISFHQIKNFDRFTQNLTTTWCDVRLRKLRTELSREDSTLLLQLPSKKMREGRIQMRETDWDTVLSGGGAKLETFKNGDPIILEGNDNPNIYQIAQGQCVIKKSKRDGDEDGGGGGEDDSSSSSNSASNSTQVLGHLQSGSLFGELTFLNQVKASVSVYAASPEVYVYIIEGSFINSLFVDQPQLAGRFYSYMASILAVRLKDLQQQMRKK
eukprot:TRINITY_DN1561_c0_g1_i1.p1 TRINITY_DN1561_c0_g1~~TRINITY_DN1561_c0_g1_i1.p1  ORF type:complete len:665 (+),score=215.25 TRINITY_DN1561_c0_g1_i1:185-1996(+)